MPEKSHDQLKRLRVAIKTRQLPDDLADWLSAGIESYMCGQSTSLCRALDLRRSGKQSVKYKRSKVQRDIALLKASECITQDSIRSGRHLKTSQIAKRLLAEIHRFETRKLPRLRRGASSDNLSDLDQALFEVFASGIRIPTSARVLYRDILKRHRKCTN